MPRARLKVDGLFNDPKFQTLAKDTCPSDKQVLDPFQFNFIIQVMSPSHKEARFRVSGCSWPLCLTLTGSLPQVPGQTVAAHLDGVYFWGASRFNVPQCEPCGS